MPTPMKGTRFGGGPAHHKLMLSNLATQLFEHGAITTTEAKARVLRPVAERLITKAKKGDLHARRQVLRTIRDKGVVHVLFTEIAPTFAERPGGYTRITKLGPRKGDNAPMAVIELVTEPYAPKESNKKKTAAPAATEAPSESAAEVEEPASDAASAEVEEPAVDAAPAEVEAPTAGTEEPEVLAVQTDSDEAVAEATAEDGSTDDKA